MRAQPSLHRHARSPRFGSILCSGWWDLDDDKQDRRVAASSPYSHRAPSPHRRRLAPPHPRRRRFFSRIAPLPPLPSAARSRLPLGPSHTHAAFARMSGVGPDHSRTHDALSPSLVTRALPPPAGRSGAWPAGERRPHQAWSRPRDSGPGPIRDRDAAGLKRPAAIAAQQLLMCGPKKLYKCLQRGDCGPPKTTSERRTASRLARGGLGGRCAHGCGPGRHERADEAHTRRRGQDGGAASLVRRGLWCSAVPRIVACVAG